MKYTLLILIVSIFLTSCKDQKSATAIIDYWQDETHPSLIKKLKIKSREKTEIRTDSKSAVILWSNGLAISPNKVREIAYFNSEGLCTLKVKPTYTMIPNDTTGYSKLSEFEQILFPKKIESNLPTGLYDSTFLFYDNDNRLLKEEHRKTHLTGKSYTDYIITYSYDEYGNVTQLCSESENISTLCRYTSFEIDSKGHIAYKIDSFSVDISRPEQANKPKKTLYKYDENGLITAIGDERFIYNEKQLLVQKYTLVGSTKTKIEDYKYDTNGNCVKVEELRKATPYSSDDQPVANGADKWARTTMTILYDKNFLQIERAINTSIESDKYSLFKYSYSY